MWPAHGRQKGEHRGPGFGNAADDLAISVLDHPDATVLVQLELQVRLDPRLIVVEGFADVSMRTTWT